MFPTLLAILSVYDKTGLIDFARDLIAQNFRILASGGTSKAIAAAGLPVEYEEHQRKNENRCYAKDGRNLTRFCELTLY